jgi:hypothetical protein
LRLAYLLGKQASSSDYTAAQRATESRPVALQTSEMHKVSFVINVYSVGTDMLMLFIEELLHKRTLYSQMRQYFVTHTF